MQLTHEPAAHFPDEHLPEGAVVDGTALTADVLESFDYVVVGSGAGGAVAAHTLAAAGYSVGIVEEGPWVKTREFGVGIYDAFKRMMRGVGMQVVRGRAFMPLLQGRCVGGSTVVNSAIAWRIPEDVTADWAARFGLGESISDRTLAPHFAALEENLHVHTAAAATLGRNNTLFLEQTQKSGLEGKPMNRYESGCQGSGRCLTGCPTAAKLGMNVSYVPWALSLGARIFTSCRALHVTIAGGRATGVVARAHHESLDPPHPKRTVRLLARLGVFVAASTIQTPNLLARSKIRGPALGEHFQAHPGLGVGGVFDDPIDMHTGVTQGAESMHFRSSDRFKLETVAIQPELAVARMPGVGPELVARMAKMKNVAIWAAQIRAEAEGTVRSGFGGSDQVRYTPLESDMVHARKALATIARLMFDAGAREVWPGVFGLPMILRSRDDVNLVADGPLDPRAYSFIATHLFGAARMGPDPRTSVVGLDFATHAVQNLYVVDSSVFPTNLGVNPQHTIMAMSRLAATRVVERGRSGKGRKRSTSRRRIRRGRIAMLLDGEEDERARTWKPEPSRIPPLGMRPSSC
jgi:choline dehydrogenase-like flavoprotein